MRSKGYMKTMAVALVLALIAFSAPGTALSGSKVEVAGGGSYTIETPYLYPGNHVTINIMSYGHGIDFYILDGENYQKFLNHEDFEYEEKTPSLIEKTIRFTAPVNTMGKYNLVISNRRHDDSVVVYIKVTYT